MARVKTFDEEEALQKAMQLFWEKGYESTSLADLTEKLEIGKGSFYLTFKSKEHLFNRCIQRYTDLNFPFLDQALESDSDFKVALQKLLEAYIDALVLDDNRKGCFMANSCSLVQESDSSVGKKIAEHYSRIETYFEQFLLGKGVNDNQAKSVSATIITFLIGASQQSKINRNKEAYLATVRNIILLLEQ